MVIGIIIFLTFVFLFYWSAFYWSIPLNQRPPKSVSARSAACEELALGNCNVSINSIIVRDFDANNDNNINEKDTLFELCKNFYNIYTEAECKKQCGCP